MPEEAPGEAPPVRETRGFAEHHEPPSADLDGPAYFHDEHKDRVPDFSWISKEVRKIEHRDAKGHLAEVARRTNERFQPGAGDNRDPPTELIPDADLPWQTDYQPSAGAASSSGPPAPPVPPELAEWDTRPSDPLDSRWRAYEWLSSKGGFPWDKLASDWQDSTKRTKSWGADFGDGKNYDYKEWTSKWNEWQSSSKWDEQD